MGEAHTSSMQTFLMLLLMVSATAVCVKWIRMPYAVALVIAGLVLGQWQALPVTMTPELVLMVFLPPALIRSLVESGQRRLEARLAAD